MGKTTVNDEPNAGVIIGRFQIPRIDKNEDNIFNFVLNKKFSTNIVIIGIPPDAIKATKTNPLDFDARRRMIEEAYKGCFKIYYIKDEKDDTVWSNHLDEMIAQILPNKIPLLVSSKKCFQKYDGKLMYEVFESSRRTNSEAVLRELAGKKVLSDEAWRAGAIWSSQNKYDSVYPTVDCAIFDGDNDIWMGRKSYEDKLRFIGGFVSPNDKSFEAAAEREAKEETGLDCKVSNYVTSQLVDDWRYKNESDKIMTTLYAMNVVSGEPKANDDIEDIYRVNLTKLSANDVVEEHKPLLKALQEWKSLPTKKK